MGYATSFFDYNRDASFGGIVGSGIWYEDWNDSVQRLYWAGGNFICASSFASADFITHILSLEDDVFTDVLWCTAPYGPDVYSPRVRTDAFSSDRDMFITQQATAIYIYTGMNAGSPSLAGNTSFASQVPGWSVGYDQFCSINHNATKAVVTGYDFYNSDVYMAIYDITNPASPIRRRFQTSYGFSYRCRVIFIQGSQNLFCMHRGGFRTQPIVIYNIAANTFSEVATVINITGDYFFSWTINGHSLLGVLTGPSFNVYEINPTTGAVTFLYDAFGPGGYSISDGINTYNYVDNISMGHDPSTGLMAFLTEAVADDINGDETYPVWATVMRLDENGPTFLWDYTGCTQDESPYRGGP